jgi:protein-ribulosamine 3-kinase
MPDWPAISAAIEERAGVRLRSRPATPVGGGDISAAWHLEGDNQAVFIKTGPSSIFEMFDAEADGLRELATANAVRVPEPLACAIAGGDAFIALEWIEFGQRTAASEHSLGERLAVLHRCTAEKFGWHRDNTIGLTPQRNTLSADWGSFFRDHRLAYQLELAESKGFTGKLQAMGRRLCDDLPALFSGYEPVPSLLHGDLWGGNWSVTNGQPVLFDPAVYYGDRETDIAMTSLFGGFGRAFYDAYQSAWPLAEGFEARQKVYQLYHVLNHLNLFGGSYLARALQLMRSS